MTTAYYLTKKENHCEHCGRCDREERHIGTNAMGWCFGLHTYPEDGINNLEDWIPLLLEGEIKDEYERTISFQKMIEIITFKRRDDGNQSARNAHGRKNGRYDLIAGEWE